MGAKLRVYRMPLIDRAWKANVNVKRIHWFWRPWFNWGWIFKDYLALEPKTLEHRTSLIFWQKMKIPDLAGSWWLWTCFLAIGVNKGLFNPNLENGVIWDEFKGPLVLRSGVVQMKIKGLYLLWYGMEIESSKTCTKTLLNV